VTIDFETEDDFTTALVDGQSVYSTPRPNRTNPSIPFSNDAVLEFGNLFNISSMIIGAGPGHLGPAIFDSNMAPAATADDDLLVDLGNVLLLHRTEGPNHDINPTYGLVFRNPNDEADFADRGSIVFDFLVPLVHPMQLDLVDVDDNVNVTVVLTDNLGRTRTYLVPENWTSDITENPAGYHTLNLDSVAPQAAGPGGTGGPATAVTTAGYNGSHVVRMEVRFLGDSPSGALDNLKFAVVPEPATLLLGLMAMGCTAAMRRRPRSVVP
jgi:hypothetical protein